MTAPIFSLFKWWNMNYNQILGKINDDTRQKVADEYNKIHKAIAIPEDYSGSVNLIDRLLKTRRC